MSNPPLPDLPDQHHYPPTTADWAMSPLAREDELLHNPLEHTNNGRPSLLLGAALVIGGGVLAIAGSLVQFVQISHLAVWYLWLVMLTSVLAIGAVVGSLALLYRITPQSIKRAFLFAFAALPAQIVEVMITLAVANAHAGQGSGAWISAGSILLLLIGGGILRLVGPAKVSGQELVDQTEKDKRMEEFTRAGKFFGIPFKPPSTPF